MKVRSPTLAALALLASTACPGRQDSASPWNTAPTATSHASFPIASSSAHGQASCDDCHSPQAPSFAQYDCRGCHGDQPTTPLHAAVAGYRWDGPACYGCHPAGTTDSPAHGARFPIRGPGVAHDAVGCAQCHVDPASRVTVDCATCHLQATTQHAAVGDYAAHADTAGCLRCHADGQVSTIASHGQFPIARGSRHGTVCLTCHPGLRADKPWGADFVGSLTCYAAGCHSSTQVASQHQGVRGFVANDSFACWRCHPSGRGG